MKFITSFILLLSLTQTSFAFTWQDLWLRNDQQAFNKLASGDPRGAANQFTEQDWQGVANYRAGLYKEAIQNFSSSSAVVDLYNKGNAFALNGQYTQAIETYDAVLAIQPKHDDAKFNRQLIQDLMNEEENQESSNPESRTPQENQPHEEEQPPESSQPDSTEDNTETHSNPEPEQAAPESNQQEEGTPRSILVENHTDQAPSQQPQASDQQEQQLAREQTLQRIPDDPGGLLKQLFYREYAKRRQ